MLRPSASDLLKKRESHYSLVVAVAKRARVIASELYESGQILDEKPVKTAVEELEQGKWRIVEDPALRHGDKN